jgi:hypothetical protein
VTQAGTGRTGLHRVFPLVLMTATIVAKEKRPSQRGVGISVRALHVDPLKGSDMSESSPIKSAPTKIVMQHGVRSPLFKIDVNDVYGGEGRPRLF